MCRGAAGSGDAAWGGVEGKAYTSKFMNFKDVVPSEEIAMKSCWDAQHLGEICSVQACPQAFLRQRTLQWIHARQVHRKLAHDIEALRHMVAVGPASIFLERHGQTPVQPVLYFPMAANGVRQLFWVGRQRTAVVPFFHRHVLRCLAHRCLASVTRAARRLAVNGLDLPDQRGTRRTHPTYENMPRAQKLGQVPLFTGESIEQCQLLVSAHTVRCISNLR